MSFVEFETKGVKFTDETEFRSEVCETCKHKEICDLWEDKTWYTLYISVAIPLDVEAGTKQIAYRCAHYEVNTE